jgi:GTPase SAR1 family protein
MALKNNHSLTLNKDGEVLSCLCIKWGFPYLIITSIYMKVAVIGDAAVGKTSLALRFTKNKFGDTYVSTIGGNYIS